jgi:hypothetical protein
MNLDEAQKILSTVKKRKLAKGIDLTVAVRGSEALLMITYHLVILTFILVPLLLKLPFILLPVVAAIFSLMVACGLLLRKVSAVKEFMMLKRIYSLDEIKQNEPGLDTFKYVAPQQPERR